MDLSEKLKNARTSRKITQKTLAEKLGVSRATLSLWESGKSTPPVCKILEYQKIFNFEKGYFNDVAKKPNENNVISFNISQLNDTAICELENFYKSLCSRKEYLKKS
ncbi:MAG: helix-turn-helix domain-containing protein [Firmicutes bacterium]|nr:helix-turn-helix domain-containing protein [Bacillota bacterium]